MQNFALKFQAVAEKTAKMLGGLLYFAAPGICNMWNGTMFEIAEGFKKKILLQ